MERVDINIVLEGEDLQRMKALLRDAEKAANALGEDAVCAKAEQLLREIESGSAPMFVRQRMGVLRKLLDMVRDADYAFDAELRRPVIAALGYFAEPHDLIPDHVPGLGFIDDAIMVEIVAHELDAEIDAYTEFAAFRDAEAARRGPDFKMDREKFLAEKRRQMFERIRTRRRRR